jgi:phosphoribosylformylglycinamidine synthase
MSAQDVSDGGLAVALAECCFDTGGQGCEVNLPAADGEADLFPPVVRTLFGESAGQVIVSAASTQVDEVLKAAAAAGVPAQVIGRTGGSAIVIRVADQPAIDLPVQEAEETWATAIARKLARPVAVSA